MDEMIMVLVVGILFMLLPFALPIIIAPLQKVSETMQTSLHVNTSVYTAKITEVSDNYWDTVKALLPLSLMGLLGIGIYVKSRRVG